MALQGFLSADTYTVVTIGRYNKQSRELQFRAVTYKTSDKLDILTTKKYQVVVEPTYTVNSKAAALPESLSAGDKFIIEASINTSPFQGDNSEPVAEYHGDGSWSKTSCGDGIKVYVQDEDQWYERKDGQWNQYDKTVYTEAQWDADFGAHNWDLENVNLTNACYGYLKTLPEWAGVVDA